MKNFNFTAPTKILFGKNKIDELAEEIKSYGNNILFAYGAGSIKKFGLYDKVINQFKKAGVNYFELSDIKPNPQLDSVNKGIKICKKNSIDFILAVGGGSVIDCCKAIAAGITYNGDPWDFTIKKAEVVNPLPLGTILTISATGSEMNGNAVISRYDTQEKRVLSHDSLRPRFSILDPTLTFTVNKWQTAAGTVDIMSHIFEQYFTTDKGTYIQDAIAEAILKTCVKYGPIALETPNNYEARANLMWASSLALNGLTATGKFFGDWASHTIEHELSAMYDLTHGVGLAILFPAWLEHVLDERRAPKIAQMSRNVFNVSIKDDIEAAKAGIQALKHFIKKLGMPLKLSEVNIESNNFEKIAKKTCIFGPIGMYKRLGHKQVKEILISAS